MDQQTRNQKWWILFFLCLCGVFFGYLIYLLATRGVDPSYSRWMVRSSEPVRIEQRAHVSQNGISSQDNYLLKLNHPQIIGKLKIIYRGIESKAILIDFVLLELDRDYIYHRRIPIIEAKDGFRLSDKRFKLESIRKDSIRLLPDKKEN